MGFPSHFRRVFAWFDISLSTPFIGFLTPATQQRRAIASAVFCMTPAGLLKSHPALWPNSTVCHHALLVCSSSLRTFTFSTYALKQFSTHSAVMLSFWVANLSQFLRSTLIKCRVPVLTLAPQRLLAYQPLALS